MKFKESSINPSFFILRQNEFVAYLFVYIDDIYSRLVVVGSIEEEVAKLIARLGNEFPMRLLGGVLLRDSGVKYSGWNSPLPNTISGQPVKELWYAKCEASNNANGNQF